MEPRNEHRADEAAHTHTDVHEAEQGPFRVAQVLRDEHRHLRLDERHHRKRRHDAQQDGVAKHGLSHDVAQPFLEVGERRLFLATLSTLRILGTEGKHEDYNQTIDHRLQEKVHLRAQQRNHAAPYTRADHAHGVERHRVQRDRVHQPLPRHGVGNQRLPQGIVQCPADAAKEREGVQMPYLNDAELEYGCEYDGQQRHVGLVQQEDDTAVELVRDDSGDGRGEHGQSAQAQHDGNLHRRPGHLVSQPAKRHLLYPGATAHEDRAEPEKPVVAVLERGERPAPSPGLPRMFGRLGALARCLHGVQLRLPASRLPRVQCR